MSFLQRRQPKGAPTGGQFATSARDETGSTLTAAPRSWQPVLQGRDPVELRKTPPPDAPPSPAMARAAAAHALHDLADTLLERRGMARLPARDNDELVNLRMAVAEQSTTQVWPDRKRDLVMSALSDENLARKADQLARMSIGRYEINAVHYLTALEVARREAAA